MSHRIRSRVLLVTTLVAALLLSMPIQAFADLNDLPSDSLGTSPTNPYDPDDADVWWREAWGNTVYPEFELNLPAGTSASAYPQILGMLYAVDRTQGTEIDEIAPDNYDTAWDPAGTMLGHMLDVPGILAGNPAGLGATDPGARLPIEGRWWFHWSFFDVSDVATRTISGPFNIDLTPPLAISKLVAKPYVEYVGPAGVWQPSTRAYAMWEDKEYDALAGVGAYEIWLNDKLMLKDTDSPNYVYHLGHTMTSFTLESLPPGKNKISVKAVDRATNVGPAVTTYFYSDPDVPKIAITSPIANGLVSRNAVFAVNATDGAGIQYVQFYLDGVLAGTDTTAPYSISKDMAAYANGTHTLVAKTKDMYGREVTDLHTFTLDKTPPSISSVTDSPDPFYPVITDAYRDFSYVNFYVNERAYAYLYIYTGSGNLFATRSAPRGPGWTGLTWDGKGYGGATGIGTFRYRVMVTDTAGNQTWSGNYYTTIRDYEIVRVAPNAVKVIPR